MIKEYIQSLYSVETYACGKSEVVIRRKEEIKYTYNKTMQKIINYDNDIKENINKHTVI